jgi:hypothetical protein
MSASDNNNRNGTNNMDRRSQRLKPLSVGPMCEVDTAQERGGFVKKCSYRYLHSLVRTDKLDS